MTALLNASRQHARKLVALVVIVILYGLSRLPTLADADRDLLAARFTFAEHTLPHLTPSQRSIRAVHPSLHRHRAWISSVGAAVALADLDGDGLPNDVIHVETRSDEIIISPAATTGERYQPFALALADRPAHVAPMGCVPADLNEDGRLDLIIYYWGRTPVAFLRRGDDDASQGPIGPDAFQPVELVPGGDAWNTNALTTADLDGDGHLDIVVGNYFPDGTRLLDPEASGSVPMQASMSRAHNGGRNVLLRWSGATAGDQPGVEYELVTDVLDDRSARRWTLAVGAADLDGDQLPELYFANDFGPDLLLHNRSSAGELRFAELQGRKTALMPNSKVLGRDSFKGMGVDFGDLNGDGVFDMFISNIADEYALEESHFAWVSSGPVESMADGVAPYHDASEPLGLSRSGWGWETRLADFDNDGVLEALQATGFVKGDIDRWPELHELAMANDAIIHEAWMWPRFVEGDDLSGHERNPFYVRAPGGRYFDLSPQLDLDAPHVTRGIATADIDGDGDLDFAIANQWEPSFLYVNRRNSPAEPARDFLGLNLLLEKRRSDEPTERRRAGVRPGHPGGDLRGRPAVGATVRVALSDGRELVARVDGGNGHSGARSHQVHLGLGAADVIGVTVTWRDGGERRSAELDVVSGWYTVLLGQSAEAFRSPLPSREGARGRVKGTPLPDWHGSLVAATGSTAQPIMNDSRAPKSQSGTDKPHSGCWSNRNLRQVARLTLPLTPSLRGRGDRNRSGGVP